MDMNKTPRKLKDIPTLDKGASVKDSVFVNERVENFRIEDCDFSHSVFDGIGIKNEKYKDRTDERPDIVGCQFYHCIFRGCYFRYVRFRNCIFVNCRFIDCDFPESMLSMCDLSYAQFHNTNIDPGTILSNLPPHENLKVGLLRSIRVNFSNRGEGDHARACFLAEMDASAIHYWKVAFDKHSFFRDKYVGFLARLKGFVMWLQLRGEHWLWGYGESPLRLIIWAAIIMGCFSIAYLNQETSFHEALRISAFAFATVGYGEGLTSITNGINWILVESLVGVVFIGLLAASLFKWISRRQR